MAHRPYGSAQTGMYPFALYCGVGLPTGFLCQGAASGHEREKQGKGKLLPLSDQGLSAHADNGMNELDLQSALHVLVHPNMGLTVRIVKRPGAELIDIALIIPQYLIHSLRVPSRAASITERGRSSLPL